jgi:hypothetical protein
LGRGVPPRLISELTNKGKRQSGVAFTTCEV